jgi:alpha-glucosidase
VTQLKWWQKAVFYQIYPRSFADGNGDGIGDLRGMIQRLDYLADLGINAIWLSPHYPSPQFDCGYDIADYTDVAPEYGTLADFREFLDGAHRRGLRVILDLVLNHTSHEHRWFIESSASRDNPKRDWYIWRDGRDGGPPNNWNSTFGGSAWEYDPRTDQYYYHFFFKQQPDLNWRNPAVRQAMWDAVRFWLDMGVDGFRLDAIGTIFERTDLPDHPVAKSMVELAAAMEFASGPADREKLEAEWEAMFAHQVEQPGMHELMQELRSVIDEYDDRVLVGENDEIVYHGNGDNELHMVFNFPLMRTKQLTPAWIRANQATRLAELAAISPDAWPCNTLGNHDSPRVKSRYGDGAHDDALARLHLALLLTLRGTPFLYNGEEIGMTDLVLQDIAQFRDLLGVWVYHAVRDDLKLPAEFALQRAADASRDRARTPLQWANAPNGGFSPAGAPAVSAWLPVNPNYAQGVNVAEQQAAPNSLLNFYRRMLHLRKQTPALIAGDYTPLHEDAPDFLAFRRHVAAGPGADSPQTCLVVLNFSDRAQTLRFDGESWSARRLFTSQARGAAPDELSRLDIGPFEIYVAELV